MDRLEATSVTPSLAATNGAVQRAPGSSGDPIHVFDENKLLMQIMARDFSNIRRAPGEYFSVTDAICVFTDCQPSSARNKWSQVKDRIWKASGTQRFQLKFFAFPYRTARAGQCGVASVQEVDEGMQRGVPCTDLRGLLIVLSQLDHPRCKDLRAYMTEIASSQMVSLPMVLHNESPKLLTPPEITKKPEARREKRSLPENTSKIATISAQAATVSAAEQEQLQRSEQQPDSPQEPATKRPKFLLQATIDTSPPKTALLSEKSDGKTALLVSTQLAERANEVATQDTPERSVVDTAVHKPNHCKADKGLRAEAKDRTEQETVLASGRHDLNGWEEEDISNPSGKRVLRQILRKMKSLYKRSEVRVAPVYLGYVDPLKNTKRFMSRGQVRSWIKKNKKNPFLRDYFDEKGRRKLAWHVDHIIPVSVGGLDHPRNYAIMPQVFNTEFGGWWSAAKAQYITLTAARHALLFAQYVRKKVQRDISLDDLEMW